MLISGGIIEQPQTIGHATLPPHTGMNPTGIVAHDGKGGQGQRGQQGNGGLAALDASGNRNAVRGTDSIIESSRHQKNIGGGKGLQVFQSLRFFSLFQDFLHHFQLKI